MNNNRRLKILFIPTWYPSKDNPVNGIFIKEYANAVSIYNEVTIIYSKREKQYKRKIYDSVENNIRTITTSYKKLFIPKTSLFIYIINIFRSFRKLKKEGWIPDIINAHIFVAGLPAIFLSKIYKIPLVISEHWSYFPLKKLKFLERIIAKFVMKRAKLILPVSNDLKKSIQDHGIKNKFNIIPNVVDTKLFYPSKKSINRPKKKILFVALLTEIKGITYLLRAIAQLKQRRQDFILDIVGNGPNKKRYKNLAMELNLKDIVKFHGQEKKLKIAERMKSCDFFVQPSLYETFCVVCIEAMACGKPVIGTQIPAFKEKINEERGILVLPRDSESLAKAIDYMLDHYNEYDPEKISKYIKGNFSYEIVGKKLNDIYQKILINNSICKK